MSVDKPPKLTDYTYDKWVVMVNIWADDSGCEAGKQANRVIRWSLEREAQDAALELGQEVLKADDGLKSLIKKLDLIYKVDDETKQYLLFGEFQNLKRTADMSISDYTMKFDRMMNKLETAKVVLPQPVLAYTYLENSNISEDKKALVRATSLTKTLADFKKALSISCEKPSQSDLGKVKQEPEDTYYTSRGGYRGRTNYQGSYRGNRNRGYGDSRRGNGGYNNNDRGRDDEYNRGTNYMRRNNNGNRSGTNEPARYNALDVKNGNIMQMLVRHLGQR